MSEFDRICERRKLYVDVMKNKVTLSKRREYHVLDFRKKKFDWKKPVRDGVHDQAGEEVLKALNY